MEDDMETLMQPRVETRSGARAEPIVVATDGLPQSHGALILARALAVRLHGIIKVVAVHQPVSLTAPDGQFLFDPDLDASLKADLLRRVRQQCTIGLEGAERVDDYEVLNGEPARVIGAMAAVGQSQFVVVGIGRHELVDRIFGDETALKVARVSHVPVLAVPEECEAIPRRALVGIDFSEGSLRAAQEALRLLVVGGILELVHVVPRDRLLFDSWVSKEEYMRFVRHSLTRFRARLTVPDGITLEDIVLSGDPARELLSYAKRIGADLVAAGSHGHGFISRLVLGSVTTKLLRTATCAVLVIPPDGHNDDRLGASANATLTLDPARWGEVLDDFTRRNTGRRTRLEIDGPESGPHCQERDYPLLGVTYYHVDGRVEIMLGELGVGEAHLSRSIGDIEQLDVITSREDDDLALRLRHRDGQTLLTLIR
jgi:nucleotide-binding universal stress UspA family protein